MLNRSHWAMERDETAWFCKLATPLALGVPTFMKIGSFVCWRIQGTKSQVRLLSCQEPIWAMLLPLPAALSSRSMISRSGRFSRLRWLGSLKLLAQHAASQERRRTHKSLSWHNCWQTLRKVFGHSWRLV